MPVPFLVPLAIMVGSQIVQSILNSEANDRNLQAQEKANRDNIAAAERANQLNRKWALEDFAQTNKYNSPEQQMVRFREAGLNPHLVYGSGAQTTASMIKSTQPHVPHVDPLKSIPFQVPDLSGAFGSMYDMQESQARIENMRAQNQLLLQRYDIGSLDIANKAIKNEKDSFSLGLAKELKDATIERALMQNRLLVADEANKYALNQNLNIMSELLHQKYNMGEVQIAKLKAEVQSIYAGTELKHIDAETRVPLAIAGALSKFGLGKVLPSLMPKLKTSKGISTTDYIRSNRMLFDKWK